MKKFILLLVLFFMTICSYGKQVSADTMSDKDKKLLIMARQYKYGIIREVNPEKAVAIYKKLAMKGNTIAMTELGQLFLKGDGVQKNTKTAFLLFRKASDMGNVKAKCKLAQMYMQGQNEIINSKKAYQLYKEAADLGSAEGMYGAGYLQYKGLGVEQNYTEALKMLKKGAEKHHPGCSMLIASYYANGFGGKQNIEMASKYYRKASRDGNSWTVDITTKHRLDSIQARRNRKNLWKHVKNKVLAETGMKKISSTIDAASIEGTWTGKIYTYDWSRKIIVDEQDIKFSVEFINDSITMKIYKNDSLFTEFYPVRKKNVYSSIYITQELQKFSWVVTESKFAKEGKYLFADLKCFNIKNTSFRKPMLAVLERDGYSTEINKINSANTFSFTSAKVSLNSMELNLTATETMDVDIVVCSVNGMTILNLGRQKLMAGNNCLIFDIPGVMQGMYVVNVSGKNERYSKNIAVHSHE